MPKRPLTNVLITISLSQDIELTRRLPIGLREFPIATRRRSIPHTKGRWTRQGEPRQAQTEMKLVNTDYPTICKDIPGVSSL